MMDNLPLNVVLEETASAYETVACLPPVIERSAGKASGKPGSRMPPGMAEVLDVDEYQRAVNELDAWAEFVVHVLIDETPGIGSVPASTPGRLRLAAQWAALLEMHPDAMLRYALQDDARTHLVTMRRLARRGTRRVRTHSACMDVACAGEYAADLVGPEMGEDITCDQCGMRVPREQWELWGSRAEWVTVKRAMSILGVATKQAVWQRAKRERWRRRGEGREVRYHVDDVQQRAPQTAA